MRGAIGAAMATVLAAASHSLAGGEVAPVSLLVTAVIALPFCVALAGKIASAWRVLLAVGASQFLYHWAFAGLGVTSGFPAGSQAALGPHAAHLASLERFVPTVAAAGSADSLMWALHAVAAVISTVLIVRGEAAVLALGKSLRRVLPRPFALAAIQRPSLPVLLREAPRLRDQLLNYLAWSLRGPPISAA